MPPESKCSQIRVGVIGFGTVGRALVEILQQLSWTTVSAIGVRSEPSVRPTGIRLFHDVSQLIASDQVDIVVEVTNDSVSSLDYLRAACLANKPFVTANKQLVAQSLLEIQEQRRKGQVVLYEAAVCASIPVLRTLATSWAAETCRSITGIVNGTTNYVLDTMYEDSTSLEQALTHARESGFAEEDSTKDIHGIDAAHKLSILMFHAFGQWIPSERIPTIGIQSITHEDISLLKERGLRPKLIASANVNDEGIAASVIPYAISKDSVFCRVAGETNALELRWEHAASQLLQGPGAGGVPTASAVIGDIVAAASKPLGVQLPSQRSVKLSCDIQPECVQVLVRGQKNIVDLLYWLSIDEYFEHGSSTCVVGTTLLGDLAHIQNNNSELSCFRLQ